MVSTLTAIQTLAVIHLLTIGCSHIIAHRPWAEFFMLLREKGRAGVFVVAFMSLGFGSIIVAFHPVWSGIPLLLTLYGWTQVLKGAVYFVFPDFGLARLGSVSIERSRGFIAPGAFLIALAGAVLYHLLTNRPV